MFGADIIISILTAFVIGVVLLPAAIPFLRRVKFGQNIRDDGPAEHKKKSGTPTMGGIVIFVSFFIGSLIFILTGKMGTDGLIIIITTALFGVLGFTDDYIKVKKKRSMGLRAWQKFLGQFLIAGLYIGYFMLRQTDARAPFGLSTTSVLVPFVSLDGGFDLGILYAPVIILAFLGGVNGVNFTDGLDGLNTGVTLIVTAFFCYAGFLAGSAADATAVTFPMLGALMAFLMYNAYPARIFMGDTGSLALGGFIVSLAVYLKMPFFLLLVGIIYVIEVLSVIIQVGYFKLTKGKRFFKMAPIHHHYELKGMSEPKVVTCFCVITALMCVIGVFAALHL